MMSRIDDVVALLDSIEKVVDNPDEYLKKYDELAALLADASVIGELKSEHMERIRAISQERTKIVIHSMSQYVYDEISKVKLEDLINPKNYEYVKEDNPAKLLEELIDVYLPMYIQDQILAIGADIHKDPLNDPDDKKYNEAMSKASEMRTMAIEQWILAAEECMRNDNIVLGKAIYAALVQTDVVRLFRKNDVNIGLSREAGKAYDRISTFFRSEAAISDLVKKAETPILNTVSAFSAASRKVGGAIENGELRTQVLAEKIDDLNKKIKAIKDNKDLALDVRNDQIRQLEAEIKTASDDIEKIRAANEQAKKSHQIECQKIYDRQFRQLNYGSKIDKSRISESLKEKFKSNPSVANYVKASRYYSAATALITKLETKLSFANSDMSSLKKKRDELESVNKQIDVLEKKIEALEARVEATTDTAERSALSGELQLANDEMRELKQTQKDNIKPLEDVNKKIDEQDKVIKDLEAKLQSALDEKRQYATEKKLFEDEQRKQRSEKYLPPKTDIKVGQYVERSSKIGSVAFKKDKNLGFYLNKLFFAKKKPDKPAPKSDKKSSAEVVPSRPNPLASTVSLPTQDASSRSRSLSTPEQVKQSPLTTPPAPQQSTTALLSTKMKTDAALGPVSSRPRAKSDGSDKRPQSALVYIPQEFRKVLEQVQLGFQLCKDFDEKTKKQHEDTLMSILNKINKPSKHAKVSQEAIKEAELLAKEAIDAIKMSASKQSSVKCKRPVASRPYSTSRHADQSAVFIPKEFDKVHKQVQQGFQLCKGLDEAPKKQHEENLDQILDQITRSVKASKSTVISSEEVKRVSIQAKQELESIIKSVSMQSKSTPTEPEKEDTLAVVHRSLH